jgi:probable HAF family extracellular repeat protein
MWTAVVFLFATLAVTIGLAAQDNPSQNNQHRHHHYKLIDVGTPGGPASHYSDQGVGSLILNQSGVVAGWGDTLIPDPNDPTLYLNHAFRYKNGVLTDLGALPGVNNSVITGLNARGWITGGSGTEIFDPLLGGFAGHGVLWTEHGITDLGTLGGYESYASYVNDIGQVVGFSTFDTVPDPYSFLGAAIHTYIWQHGTMRDIGTLGGPDTGATPGGINQQRDLVAGASFTSYIPNPGTGIPTQDPFLWRNGVMTDLGTLGGTIGGAQAVNNNAQVTGQSDLAGDQTFHSFFWDRGVMTDLGTLGGDTVTSIWLNDDGEVVGKADTSVPGVFHAFLWKHGTIRDLGQVGSDPCSSARAINSHEQIVGSGSDCIRAPLHAFLSEDGGPLVDLNTLVSDGPDFQALIAYNVNERGEIAGTGVPSGCDRVDLCGHVFLMIPCDDKHPGECRDYSLVDIPDQEVAAQTLVLPPNFKPGLRSSVRRLDSWSDGFGQRRATGQSPTPLE